MLVVIGTDCLDSCKSNYHAITTTTAHIQNENGITMEHNGKSIFFFLQPRLQQGK
jgi:hypothetical protein